LGITVVIDHRSTLEIDALAVFTPLRIFTRVAFIDAIFALTILTFVPPVLLLRLVALGEQNKVLLRKKFSHPQLLAYTANLLAALIGLEACAGAHFVGTALRDRGPPFRHKRGPPKLRSPDVLASPPSKSLQAKNTTRAAIAANTRHG
jgi:hypothetical protein